MAILKGDWVLVEGEGVGQVTVENFHPKTHLVSLVGGSYTFAVCRQEALLTKIDPAFYVLLTDVNKESENGKATS
ncbi:hypothetical protein [Flavobacterium sp.]|uniref:hypothetical protein n=1 Tax=Flavobacterium sp. TaxID=239 RepID=UPI0037C0F9FC